jgi:hypothetical protein
VLQPGKAQPAAYTDQQQTSSTQQKAAAKPSRQQRARSKKINTHACTHAKHIDIDGTVDISNSLHLLYCYHTLQYLVITLYYYTLCNAEQIVLKGGDVALFH